MSFISLMIFGIGLVVGFGAGVIFYMFNQEKLDPSGKILVAQDDNEQEPYVFLELNKPIDSILREETILLEVSDKIIKPQE